MLGEILDIDGLKSSDMSGFFNVTANLGLLLFSAGIGYMGHARLSASAAGQGIRWQNVVAAVGVGGAGAGLYYLGKKNDNRALKVLGGAMATAGIFYLMSTAKKSNMKGWQKWTAIGATATGGAVFLAGNIWKDKPISPYLRNIGLAVSTLGLAAFTWGHKSTRNYFIAAATGIPAMAAFLEATNNLAVKPLLNLIDPSLGYASHLAEDGDGKTVPVGPSFADIYKTNLFGEDYVIDSEGNKQMRSYYIYSRESGQYEKKSRLAGGNWPAALIKGALLLGIANTARVYKSTYNKLPFSKGPFRAFADKLKEPWINSSRAANRLIYGGGREIIKYNLRNTLPGASLIIAAVLPTKDKKTLLEHMGLGNWKGAALTVGISMLASGLAATVGARVVRGASKGWQNAFTKTYAAVNTPIGYGLNAAYTLFAVIAPLHAVVEQSSRLFKVFVIPSAQTGLERFFLNNTFGAFWRPAEYDQEGLLIPGTGSDLKYNGKGWFEQIRVAYKSGLLGSYTVQDAEVELRQQLGEEAWKGLSESERRNKLNNLLKTPEWQSKIERPKVPSFRALLSKGPLALGDALWNADPGHTSVIFSVVLAVLHQPLNALLSNIRAGDFGRKFRAIGKGLVMSTNLGLGDALKSGASTGASGFGQMAKQGILARIEGGANLLVKGTVEEVLVEQAVGAVSAPFFGILRTALPGLGGLLALGEEIWQEVATPDGPAMPSANARRFWYQMNADAGITLIDINGNPGAYSAIDIINDDRVLDMLSSLNNGDTVTLENSDGFKRVFEVDDATRWGNMFKAEKMGFEFGADLYSGKLSADTFIGILNKEAVIDDGKGGFRVPDAVERMAALNVVARFSQPEHIAKGIHPSSAGIVTVKSGSKAASIPLSILFDRYYERMAFDQDLAEKVKAAYSSINPGVPFSYDNAEGFGFDIIASSGANASFEQSYINSHGSRVSAPRYYYQLSGQTIEAFRRGERFVDGQGRGIAAARVTEIRTVEGMYEAIQGQAVSAQAGRGAAGIGDLGQNVVFIDASEDLDLSDPLASQLVRHERREAARIVRTGNRLLDIDAARQESGRVGMQDETVIQGPFVPIAPARAPPLVVSFSGGHQETTPTVTSTPTSERQEAAARLIDSPQGDRAAENAHENSEQLSARKSVPTPYMQKKAARAERLLAEATFEMHMAAVESLREAELPSESDRYLELSQQKESITGQAGYFKGLVRYGINFNNLFEELRFELIQDRQAGIKERIARELYGDKEARQEKLEGLRKNLMSFKGSSDDAEGKAAKKMAGIEDYFRGYVRRIERYDSHRFSLRDHFYGAERSRQSDYADIMGLIVGAGVEPAQLGLAGWSEIGRDIVSKDDSAASGNRVFKVGEKMIEVVRVQDGFSAEQIQGLAASMGEEALGGNNDTFFFIREEAGFQPFHSRAEQMQPQEGSSIMRNGEALRVGKLGHTRTQTIKIGESTARSWRLSETDDLRLIDHGAGDFSLGGRRFKLGGGNGTAKTEVVDLPGSSSRYIFTRNGGEDIQVQSVTYDSPAQLSQVDSGDQWQAELGDRKVTLSRREGILYLALAAVAGNETGEIPVDQALAGNPVMLNDRQAVQIIFDGNDVPVSVAPLDIGPTKNLAATEAEDMYEVSLDGNGGRILLDGARLAETVKKTADDPIRLFTTRGADHGFDLTLHRNGAEGQVDVTVQPFRFNFTSTKRGERQSARKMIEVKAEELKANRNYELSQVGSGKDGRSQRRRLKRRHAAEDMALNSLFSLLEDGKLSSKGLRGMLISPVWDSLVQQREEQVKFDNIQQRADRRQKVSQAEKRFLKEEKARRRKERKLAEAQAEAAQQVNQSEVEPPKPAASQQPPVMSSEQEALKELRLRYRGRGDVTTLGIMDSGVIARLQEMIERKTGERLEGHQVMGLSFSAIEERLGIDLSQPAAATKAVRQETTQNLKIGDNGWIWSTNGGDGDKQRLRVYSAKVAVFIENGRILVDEWSAGGDRWYRMPFSISPTEFYSSKDEAIKAARKVWGEKLPIDLIEHSIAKQNPLGAIITHLEQDPQVKGLLDGRVKDLARIIWDARQEVMGNLANQSVKEFAENVKQAIQQRIAQQPQLQAAIGELTPEKLGLFTHAGYGGVAAARPATFGAAGVARIFGKTPEQRVNRLVRAIAREVVNPAEINDLISQSFGPQYIQFFERYPTGFSRFLADGHRFGAQVGRLSFDIASHQPDQDDFYSIPTIPEVERNISSILEIYEASPELARLMTGDNRYPPEIKDVAKVLKEHGETAIGLVRLSIEKGVATDELRNLSSTIKRERLSVADVSRRLKWAADKGYDLKQVVENYGRYPQAVGLSIDLGIYQPAKESMEMLTGWLKKDASKTRDTLQNGISLTELDRYLRLENFFGSNTAMSMLRQMRIEASQNGWTTARDKPQDISDVYEVEKREEGLSATDLILVHKTNYLPRNGKILTTSNAIGWGGRDTVHFCLNGPVGSHFWGNWDDASYIVLIPLYKVPKQKVENNLPADTYLLGDVELPEGALVLGMRGTPQPTPQDLGRAKYYEIEPTEEAINKVIADLGYTPMRVGKEFWVGEFNMNKKYISEEFGRREGIPRHGLHTYEWHSRYEGIKHNDFPSLISATIEGLVDLFWGEPIRAEASEREGSYVSPVLREHLIDDLVGLLVDTQGFVNDEEYGRVQKVRPEYRRKAIEHIDSFFEYAGIPKVDFIRLNQDELKTLAVELSEKGLKRWVLENQTVANGLRNQEQRYQRYNLSAQIKVDDGYLREIEAQIGSPKPAAATQAGQGDVQHLGAGIDFVRAPLRLLFPQFAARDGGFQWRQAFRALARKLGAAGAGSMSTDTVSSLMAKAQTSRRGLGRVNVLESSKITAADLPTGYSTVSGLREVRPLSESPLSLNQVPKVKVTLPGIDTFLTSPYHEGSSSMVLVGFLPAEEAGKAPRPVALKYAYELNRDPIFGIEYRTGNARITLEEYGQAKIAEELGIAPKVHGISKARGKLWLVMDIVPGDFAGAVPENINLNTVREFIELHRRLSQHEVSIFDMQFFVTPRGHIQLIDTEGLHRISPEQLDIALFGELLVRLKGETLIASLKYIAKEHPDLFAGIYNYARREQERRDSMMIKAVDKVVSALDQVKLGAAVATSGGRRQVAPHRGKERVATVAGRTTAKTGIRKAIVPVALIAALTISALTMGCSRIAKSEPLPKSTSAGEVIRDYRGDIAALEGLLPVDTAGTIIVQPGDNLTKISDALGLPMASIRRLSGVKDIHVLRVGQKLAYPSALRLETVEIKDVGYHAVVDRTTNTMFIKANDTLRVIPIVAGAEATPTRLGEYRIGELTFRTPWFHGGKAVRYGQKDYPYTDLHLDLIYLGRVEGPYNAGIHGASDAIGGQGIFTRADKGRNLSHGCIRTPEEALQLLSEGLRPGDRVLVVDTIPAELMGGMRSPKFKTGAVVPGVGGGLGLARAALLNSIVGALPVQDQEIPLAPKPAAPMQQPMGMPNQAPVAPQQIPINANSAIPFLGLSLITPATGAGAAAAVSPYIAAGLALVTAGVYAYWSYRQQNGMTVVSHTKAGPIGGAAVLGASAGRGLRQTRKLGNRLIRSVGSVVGGKGSRTTSGRSGARGATETTEGQGSQGVTSRPPKQEAQGRYGPKAAKPSLSALRVILISAGALAGIAAKPVHPVDPTLIISVAAIAISSIALIVALKEARRNSREAKNIAIMNHLAETKCLPRRALNVKTGVLCSLRGWFKKFEGEDLAHPKYGANKYSIKIGPFAQSLLNNSRLANEYIPETAAIFYWMDTELKTKARLKAEAVARFKKQVAADKAAAKEARQRAEAEAARVRAEEEARLAAEKARLEAEAEERARSEEERRQVGANARAEAEAARAEAERKTRLEEQRKQAETEKRARSETEARAEEAEAKARAEAETKQRDEAAAAEEKTQVTANLPAIYVGYFSHALDNLIAGFYNTRFSNEADLELGIAALESLFDKLIPADKTEKREELDARIRFNMVKHNKKAEVARIEARRAKIRKGAKNARRMIPRLLSFIYRVLGVVAKHVPAQRGSTPLELLGAITVIGVVLAIGIIKDYAVSHQLGLILAAVSGAVALAVILAKTLKTAARAPNALGAVVTNIVNKSKALLTKPQPKLSVVGRGAAIVVSGARAVPIPPGTDPRAGSRTTKSVYLDYGLVLLVALLSPLLLGAASTTGSNNNIPFDMILSVGWPYLALLGAMFVWAKAHNGSYSFMVNSGAIFPLLYGFIIAVPNLLISRLLANPWMRCHGFNLLFDAPLYLTLFMSFAACAGHALVRGWSWWTDENVLTQKWQELSERISSTGRFQVNPRIFSAVAILVLALLIGSEILGGWINRHPMLILIHDFFEHPMAMFIYILDHGVGAALNNLSIKHLTTYDTGDIFCFIVSMLSSWFAGMVILRLARAGRQNGIRIGIIPWAMFLAGPLALLAEKLFTAIKKDHGKSMGSDIRGPNQDAEATATELQNQGATVIYVGEVFPMGALFKTHDSVDAFVARLKKDGVHFDEKDVSDLMLLLEDFTTNIGKHVCSIMAGYGYIIMYLQGRRLTTLLLDNADGFDPQKAMVKYGDDSKNHCFAKVRNLSEKLKAKGVIDDAKLEFFTKENSDGSVVALTIEFKPGAVVATRGRVTRLMELISAYEREQGVNWNDIFDAKREEVFATIGDLLSGKEVGGDRLYTGVYGAVVKFAKTGCAITTNFLTTNLLSYGPIDKRGFWIYIANNQPAQQLTEELLKLAVGFKVKDGVKVILSSDEGDITIEDSEIQYHPVKLLWTAQAEQEGFLVELGTLLDRYEDAEIKVRLLNILKGVTAFADNYAQRALAEVLAEETSGSDRAPGKTTPPSSGRGTGAAALLIAALAGMAQAAPEGDSIVTNIISSLKDIFDKNQIRITGAIIVAFIVFIGFLYFKRAFTAARHDRRFEDTLRGRRLPGILMAIISAALLLAPSIASGAEGAASQAQATPLAGAAAKVATATILGITLPVWGWVAIGAEIAIIAGIVAIAQRKKIAAIIRGLRTKAQAKQHPVRAEPALARAYRTAAASGCYYDENDNNPVSSKENRFNPSLFLSLLLFAGFIGLWTFFPNLPRIGKYDLLITSGALLAGLSIAGLAVYHNYKNALFKRQILGELKPYIWLTLGIILASVLTQALIIAFYRIPIDLYLPDDGVASQIRKASWLIISAGWGIFLKGGIGFEPLFHAINLKGALRLVMGVTIILIGPFLLLSKVKTAKKFRAEILFLSVLLAASASQYINYLLGAGMILDYFRIGALVTNLPDICVVMSALGYFSYLLIIIFIGFIKAVGRLKLAPEIRAKPKCPLAERVMVAGMSTVARAEDANALGTVPVAKSRPRAVATTILAICVIFGLAQAADVPLAAGAAAATFVISPFISVPLIIIGAAALLIGAGYLGRYFGGAYKKPADLSDAGTNEEPVEKAIRRLKENIERHMAPFGDLTDPDKVSRRIKTLESLFGQLKALREELESTRECHARLLKEAEYKYAQYVGLRDELAGYQVKQTADKVRRINALVFDLNLLKQQLARLEESHADAVEKHKKLYARYGAFLKWAEKYEAQLKGLLEISAEKEAEAKAFTRELLLLNIFERYQQWLKGARADLRPKEKKQALREMIVEYLVAESAQMLMSKQQKTAIYELAYDKEKKADIYAAVGELLDEATYAEILSTLGLFRRDQALDRVWYAKKASRVIGHKIDEIKKEYYSKYYAHSMNIEYLEQLRKKLVSSREELDRNYALYRDRQDEVARINARRIAIEIARLKQEIKSIETKWDDYIAAWDRAEVYYNRPRRNTQIPAHVYDVISNFRVPSLTATAIASAVVLIGVGLCLLPSVANAQGLPAGDEVAPQDSILPQHLPQADYQWLMQQHNPQTGLFASFQVTDNSFLDSRGQDLTGYASLYDQGLAAMDLMNRGDYATPRQVFASLYMKALKKDGIPYLAYDAANGLPKDSLLKAGDPLWLGIAMAHYTNDTRDGQFMPFMERIGDFALGLQQADGRILGGPTFDWAPTEYAHDGLAYFGMLYQLTGNEKWRVAQAKAAHWLNWQGYDRQKKIFNRGAQDPIFASDAQFLGVLSHPCLPESLYHVEPALLLSAAEARASVTVNGIKGFDFTDSRGVISGEWTAEGAVAYKVAGNQAKGDFYIGELAKLEDKGGIRYATSIAEIFHGENWWANTYPSVAATVWRNFAREGFNPFILRDGGQPVKGDQRGEVKLPQTQPSGEIVEVIDQMAEVNARIARISGRIAAVNDTIAGNAYKRAKYQTASRDVLNAYLKVFQADPVNAIPPFVGDLKGALERKSKDMVFRVGLGYKRMSSPGSVLSLRGPEKLGLEDIYVHLMVPAEYQPWVDGFMAVKDITGLVLGTPATRTYALAVPYIVDNVVFNIPNQIKMNQYRGQGGVMVAPEGAPLFHLSGTSNPVWKTAVFHPDAAIAADTWSRRGEVKLTNLTLTKIPDDLLREGLGRIPGIGKIFGDYHQQAVFEKAQFPAVVIFGRSHSEFYRQALQDTDRNHIYIVRRSGEYATGIMLDLASRQATEYFNSPWFIKGQDGEVLTRKFCELQGLWVEDGASAVIPSFWMLEEIEKQYEVIIGQDNFGNQIAGALKHPITGEILNIYNSTKDLPRTIQRHYDNKLTDFAVDCVIGEWGDGTPMNPVVIYSQPLSIGNYWMWRKISADELGRIKGDFIPFDSVAYAVALTPGDSLENKKLTKPMRVKFAQADKLLPVGFEISYLNGKPGIFVPKPESIPLARLSLERGSHTLYNQKEIDRLIAVTLSDSLPFTVKWTDMQDSVHSKTYYMGEGTNIVAGVPGSPVLEYGINARDLVGEAGPDIYAFKISPDGNVTACPGLPLAAEDKPLGEQLRDHPNIIPAAGLFLENIGIESFAVRMSEMGVDVDTADINMLKALQQKMWGAESIIVGSQEGFEAARVVYEQAAREYANKGLPVLVRAFNSAVRLLEEGKVKLEGKMLVYHWLHQIALEMSEGDSARTDSLYNSFIMDMKGKGAEAGMDYILDDSLKGYFNWQKNNLTQDTLPLVKRIANTDTMITYLENLAAGQVKNDTNPYNFEAGDSLAAESTAANFDTLYQRIQKVGGDSTVNRYGVTQGQLDTTRLNWLSARHDSIALRDSVGGKRANPDNIVPADTNYAFGKSIHFRKKADDIDSVGLGLKPNPDSIVPADTNYAFGKSRAFRQKADDIDSVGLGLKPNPDSIVPADTNYAFGESRDFQKRKIAIDRVGLDSVLNPYGFTPADTHDAALHVLDAQGAKVVLNYMLESGDTTGLGNFIPGIDTIILWQNYWRDQKDTIELVMRPYWQAQHDTALISGYQPWITWSDSMLLSVDRYDSMAGINLYDLHMDSLIRGGQSQEDSMQIVVRKIGVFDMREFYYSDLFGILVEGMNLNIPNLSGIGDFITARESVHAGRLWIAGQQDSLDSWIDYYRSRADTMDALGETDYAADLRWRADNYDNLYRPFLIAND
ncbi:L,D-transpeptidase family protein, partial [Candidatus Omnitrophota bacterium]